MKKILLTLSIALSLVACSDDNDAPVTIPNDYETGYFITNEGNFMSANADVSFLTNNFSDIENGIFQTVNNRALGDVAQSMTMNGNNAYVVVNNSNTIEVVEKTTFKSKATISANLNMPRYAVVANSKLYVTNAGNNSVTYYNVSDQTFGGSIALDFTPEQIVSAGNYVYVAANAWGTNYKIAVINPTNNDVVAQITMPGAINGITQNGNTVYTLSNSTTTAFINKIEGLQNVQLASIPENNTRFLAYENGKLFYTSGVAIKSLNLSNNQVSSIFSVTDTGWSAIYGFNVLDGKLFVLDAQSFTAPSLVKIYDMNGTLLNSKTAGIGANAVYKIN